MMFKLIIVSFIAIIVVLFVRLSYLKYIKQDLDQELDELKHKQKIKKGETKIWKKGHTTFKLERIPFDWQALIVYILLISIIIWLIIK